MKIQTTSNPAPVIKTANESSSGDPLLDSLRDLKTFNVRRVRRHQKLLNSFYSLSQEKRDIIINQLGTIEEISERGLLSITDDGRAVHLEYMSTSARPPKTITFQYAMDGSRITEAGASPAKGRADSHASSAPAPPRANEVGTAPPRTTKSQPGRANRVQLGTWIDPAYKHNLLMVRAKVPANRTAESLVEEALNDLFRKYDVPTLPLSEYRRPGPKRSLGN